MALLRQVVLVAVVSLSFPLHATEQRIGDFEIAIDAPWRMEPRQAAVGFCDTNCESNSSFEYGAIPINIAILDAFLPNSETENSFLIQRALQGNERGDIGLLDIIEDLVNPFENLFSNYPNMIVEEFRSLTISEQINGRFVTQRTFRVNDLHEVERTIGRWQWSSDKANPPRRPRRELCRRWLEEDCGAFIGLSNTSEWHAITLYQPQNVTPGTDVRLKLELEVVAQVDSNRETSKFTQYVNVHLGEAPLPKFSQDWYYGDLHYHSQGTDNDGESGYSYRSALQAMGAMGLDFAFATDHASNSKQIISASVSPPKGVTSPNVLRDLSPDRFAHGVSVLNGPGGANREVASYPRKNFQHSLKPVAALGNPPKRQLVVPQLFMGAEVDVIPEFRVGENPYFQFSRACKDLPKALIRAENGGGLDALVGAIGDIDQINTSDPNPSVCGDDDLTTATNDGRILIRDIQGPHNGHLVSKNFFGRQHMLHLPQDPLRADAFISSDTSKYGGATRRLRDILNSEFTTPNGVVFLAHPNSSPSGSDFGRLGPDIAPYADAPLLDAFRSPNVLGLQLWNENNYFKTDMGQGDAVSTRPDLRSARPDSTCPTDGRPEIYSCFEGELIPVADLATWRHDRATNGSVGGLSMWDSMLMWGLDPSVTASIGWLPENRPRRFFLAGGSDAHGDYNYRREGYFVGISAIGDTALGSPRNLIFAGPPQGADLQVGQYTGTPVSQTQVINALRDGNYIVTDGPIIRLAYDANDNGKIDRQDIPMGGVVDGDQCGFPLLVEWKSTPEFGPVSTIDLKLGVFSDKYADGWVYQPWHPNPNEPSKKPSDYYFNTWTETSTGRTLTNSELSSPLGWRGEPRSHFWDPSTDSVLTINISPGRQFGGVRQITIEPKSFPVAQLKEENNCPALQNTDSKTRTVEAMNAEMSMQPQAEIAKKQTLTVKQNQRFPNRPNGGLGDFDEADVFAPDPVIPPVDPSCITRQFENPVIADRMYIRAELKGKRRAFSNPIWFNLKQDSQQLCAVSAPTENAPVEKPQRCTKLSDATCQLKGASCEVLVATNKSSSDVCRWKTRNSPNSCKAAGGIWTTVQSGFAQKHPKAVPTGQAASCISQASNLICKAKETKICKSYGASCEVANNVDGGKVNLCRWDEASNEAACKRTVGIWTHVRSKYARKHPSAIRLGSMGACITDAKNLENRIQ